MKKIITIILALILSFNISACDKESKLSLYEIDAILNENSLSCEMTLNYVNNSGKSVSELYFNLYPNAFRENAKIKPIHTEYFLKAYPNGDSYGNITIKKVNTKNQNLDFAIEGEDENILKVNLDSPVKVGNSTEISISFDVLIPNVLHRFGYGENTINLTGFYPILCEEYLGEVYKSVYYPSGDPFYSSVADYKVSITLPSSLVVASSLSPIKTEILEYKTKYSYEREKVRDIAFILSSKFNILKDKVGETDVYYYYFNDESPEESFSVIKNSLAFYSSKFIKYPYKEYVVCEADFIYGGMEYPCLTLIDSSLKGEDRAYSLAHETAHEWWYGLVGVNQSEEGFIDEGLTEFSTLLFMSKYLNMNRKEHVKTIKERYREIRKYSVLYSSEKRAVMARNLGSYKNDAEYVSIAYYRSQIMFNDCYEYMGERKFYKFLQALSSNYKYKNITYKELKNLAEKIKKGSAKLLDGYVNGETAI